MTYNKLSDYKTTVHCEDGWYKVVYHSTIIVKWNSNEAVLNSGGWHTATTKKKMNQVANQFDLGFQVFQKDFEWFVHIPMVDDFEYMDGMSVNLGDNVVNGWVSYPDL